MDAEETAARIRKYVQPDRIHSRMYFDDEIFDLEMDRIFSRDWIYLAHDSELPNPGSFVTRRMGVTPVVVTRDDDGEIHVVVNRCTHRGNVVCLREAGSASHLRCAYHGWTFGLDGQCVARTFPDAYDGVHQSFAIDMVAIPRVAVYRGLIFASAAVDGLPLVDRLGHARQRLDQFLDRAPAGTVRVAGVHRMKMRANWKMPLENSVDDYHPTFVHRGVVEFDKALKAAMGTTDDRHGVVRDLGGGHSELDFSTGERTIGGAFVEPIPQDVLDTYEAQLRERLGSDKADAVLHTAVPHMMVFPNLFIVQNDFRVIVPISARLTHYYHYFLDLVGADPIINWTRRRRHEVSYGAAGSIVGDDLDVFERNQIGIESSLVGSDTWLDLSRGIGREVTDANGFTVSATKDETGMRGIWRHYLEAMSASDRVESA